MVRPALSATGASRGTFSTTASVVKPPVSTPWASGENTIWPMPSLSHNGKTLPSGRRHSIEYIGWLDVNRSTPGSSAVAWIWEGVHSLNPMYRALPCRTASVSDVIGLRQPRLLVVAVALVEVNVVGAQPAQRGVELLADLRCAES